ncbi:MAG TPA: HypC/HybG/HupF family hydrogenase formation chaperone [Thermoplasmata archaeon]|nr:HypC/HybG/HupF family hydrogenase formation chaperone [Thermoplasmata archaeon]
MCLAVPGRIVSVEVAEADVRLAQVDFGGPVKTVNLAFTPEARVNDFVIAHAGFATQILPEAEAREAIEYVRRLRAGPAADAAAVPPVEG